MYNVRIPVCVWVRCRMRCWNYNGCTICSVSLPRSRTTPAVSLWSPVAHWSATTTSDKVITSADGTIQPVHYSKSPDRGPPAKRFAGPGGQRAVNFLDRLLATVKSDDNGDKGPAKYGRRVTERDGQHGIISRNKSYVWAATAIDRPVVGYRHGDIVGRTDAVIVFIVSRRRDAANCDWRQIELGRAH